MRFVSLLEEKIINLYRLHGIKKINDLSIHNMADIFNIKIQYYHLNSRCISDDHCAMILLKNNQSIEMERADFFHEIGHFFAHVGDQRQMNRAFIRLQESQAHWISLYASMPRYIFEPIMKETTSFSELVELFQLPDTMIRERIRIIHQQNNTESYYNNLKIQEESRQSRSLQKGKIYDSTLEVLSKLKSQVGEEKLSYDIQSLLR